MLSSRLSMLWDIAWVSVGSRLSTRGQMSFLMSRALIQLCERLSNSCWHFSVVSLCCLRGGCISCQWFWWKGNNCGFVPHNVSIQALIDKKRVKVQGFLDKAGRDIDDGKASHEYDNADSQKQLADLRTKNEQLARALSSTLNSFNAHIDEMRNRWMLWKRMEWRTERWHMFSLACSAG